MSRTRTRSLPPWLMVLLVLAAIVVLGPPAVGLVAGLLALAVGLAAVALKVGLVVLAVYAVFALLRAVFGTSRPTPEDRLDSAPVRTLEDVEPVDAQRQALDAELERAIAAAQKEPRAV